MEILELGLEEIKPYEKNPRNNDNAVDAVANSIREFGFKVPIIIDKGNIIVAGHTRYKAAQKLGLKKVPCIKADDLTEEQIKAFRLADNKVSEQATWDFDLLNEELEGLTMDMSQFGFDLPEEEKEMKIVEDEVPDVPEEPKSKYGDIYQLGNHRLMCGDSTNQNDVEKLMNGAKADMIFTDPPYGMKKENDGVANDNLNYDDLLEFNKKWFEVCYNALKDTGCFYIWGIDEPLMDMYSSIFKPLKKQNKLVIRNYITWAKHVAFGINSQQALSFPKETEKCWFVMKGQDWNNTNAEFFSTKYSQMLEYLQNQAEQENITAKDIQRVTGVQMYGHWFTKSQFTPIPQEHYTKLQKAYPNAFKLNYAQFKNLIDEDNNLNVKPYFDNVAEERVGDIGLTDVWRFNTTNGKERESAGGHATPKPIALCARGIKASSKEKENVLDVFGGSGSTLIACEQLNRKAYLMELEPQWVDVIIQRWENLTGQKARKIEG